MAVTYDATGVGFAGLAGSCTFNHTASAGAYVIVAICTDRSTSSVTCNWGGSGGTPMTLLGSVNHNNSSANGTLYYYGIGGVSAGTTSVYVSVTFSAGWLIANSVSYLNVGSPGSATTNYGSGTSYTNTVTCPSNGMVVNSLAFGEGGGAITGAIISPSGGTERSNQYTNSTSVCPNAMDISDATSTTTFTGITSGSSAFWSALGVPLNAAVIITPTGALISITGGSPPSGPVTVTPTTATVAITGGTPTLRIGIPITFDAVAVGTGSGTSMTLTHTASPGAYVLVGVAANSSNDATAVSYGGVPMTLLGGPYYVSSPYGACRLYGLAAVTGGAPATVTITLSGGSGAVEAAVVSYVNVFSVGTVATSTTASQTVSIGSGSMIVQVLALDDSVADASITSMTGGTLRANNNASGYGAIAVTDSTTSTTFAATKGGGGGWLGMALVLTAPPGPIVTPTGATIHVTTTTAAISYTGPITVNPVPALIAIQTGIIYSPTTATVALSTTNPSVFIVPMVAYDATGTGATGTAFSGSTGTTITWTHNFGPNASAVIVGVNGVNTHVASYANYTRTLTMGSTPLTLLGASDLSGADGWIELWALSGPAVSAVAGTSQSFTLNETYTSNGAQYYPDMQACSVSYNYAGAVSKAYIANGGANVCLGPVIPSATGHIAVMAIGGSRWSSGSATVRYNYNNIYGSPQYEALLIEDTPGASPSVQMSASSPDDGYYAAVGADISGVGIFLIPAAKTVAITGSNPTFTITGSVIAFPTTKTIHLTGSTPVVSGLATVLNPKAAQIVVVGGIAFIPGLPVITAPGAILGPNIRVRYPAGPITPHGGCYMLSDRLPMLAYRSFDDSAVFNLSGPLSIADRTAPEAIKLTGIKGLIPPWQSISQKGASQDGATYVTSLYDPIEVDLEFHATGRDPAFCRQVVADFIESWDAKQPGELSWFTPRLGRWWAAVRWDKTPTDKLLGGNHPYEKFSITAKAYNGFWQSYDDVQQFSFTYDAVSDNFAYVTSGTGAYTDLGANWTCAYTGSGGGWIQASNTLSILGLTLAFPGGGGQAMWIEDPSNPNPNAGRTVVCRYNNFVTDTDNQVIAVKLGSFDEVGFPSNAFTDIWGRMSVGGVPGSDGIRVRFGVGALILSMFNGGTETVLRSQPMLIPPLAGDTYTLLCGSDTNPYLFTVQRNGNTIMTASQPSASAAFGPSYRGVGFGMAAGASILDQAKPSTVLLFQAGDNANVTQSGWLTRVNCGDQPRFDRMTCYGPGTFTIQDGPNSSNGVVFGPLLDNQVMQLRTDPTKRGVVDLTGTPPPPQQQTAWQQALADFISWATANNAPPLLTAIESALGIIPPQGNPYSLLNGRFSDNSAIPPKPPGQPPVPYQVQVSIEGGNAASRIVAAGTPLRRYPL